MKKIANKTICLLLTLVMLLGVMPLAGIGTFRAKAAEAGVNVLKKKNCIHFQHNITLYLIAQSDKFLMRIWIT